MSKVIPFIVGALLFVGVVGLSYQKITLVKKEMSTLQSEKIELSSHLDLANNEIEELSEENEDLFTRIEILRDSISNYQTEIKSLKKSLYKSRKEVEKMENAMQKMRSDYFALEQQIIEIKANKTNKDNIIVELENQKLQLQMQNDSLYIACNKIKKSLEDSSEDIVDLEMQKLKQEELLEILEFTTIYFDKISIKKAETGQDQKKIKKDGRVWNYTYIDLSMQHDNIRHLIDEEFVLKILDVDSGEELSFIESNPAFPDSENNHKGLKFQFIGEPMQLVFHNNEIKEGTNYAVQLYYFDNGKEYRLKNGFKQFIINRKLKSN